MNRFMLDLRSLNGVNNTDSSSEYPFQSRASSPDFRIPESVLGNIGEPLQYGQEGFDDDDRELGPWE